MSQYRAISGFIIQGQERFPAVLTFEPHNSHVTVMHERSVDHSEITKYYDTDRDSNGGIGIKGLKPGPAFLVFRSMNPGDGYNLYGCSMQGITSNSVSPFFMITVKFELAVQQSSFDINADSTDRLKITGLRQNFSYLSDWFDSRIAWIHYDKDLTKIQQIVPEDTHKEKASVELLLSHPLKLDMLFSRSSTMLSGHRPVSLSLKPATFVSLMTDHPVDIQTYRVWGRQVCGLIQIATNQQIKPQAISVRREVPSDGSEGVFYPLMSEDSDVNSTLADSPTYLFDFEDIHLEGIARWLELCDRYHDGIGSVIYLSVYQHGGLPLESMALITGVAIENIGDQLCEDDGVPTKSHGQRSFNTQLEEILKQKCLKGLLVENSDTITKWRDEVNNAYNGTKHRDRESEPPAKVYHYSHEGYLLLKYWIAIQIGCPVVKIKKDIAREKRYKVTSRGEMPEVVSIFR